jgi:hypothetical protein
MKKCPYCGEHYPATMSICPTDGSQLTVASEMVKENACTRRTSRLRFRFKMLWDIGGPSTRRDSAFWMLFNLLCRIGGVGFVIYGFVFSVWGLVLVLNAKSTMLVNGIPTRDPLDNYAMLIMGIVVALLGFLFLVSRRYRPDLGDSAFSKSSRRDHAPLESIRTAEGHPKRGSAAEQTPE